MTDEPHITPEYIDQAECISRLGDEIVRLRAALQPLVRVAEAVDRRGTNMSMPDSAGLWTEQSNFKENIRLTIGDARHARKVFDGKD